MASSGHGRVQKGQRTHEQGGTASGPQAMVECRKDSRTRHPWSSSWAWRSLIGRDIQCYNRPHNSRIWASSLCTRILFDQFRSLGVLRFWFPCSGWQNFSAGVFLDFSSEKSVLVCVFLIIQHGCLQLRGVGGFFSLEWWSEEEEGDSGKSVVGRLTTKVPPLGGGRRRRWTL
jgi:hypothetical protein